jgi:DNA-binding response OmpR family regulator
MKVLVVDDNSVIRSVIEAILNQENHEIFCAGNGMVGYSLFMSCWPDMVITDIEMPWQDGLTMMQRIRSHAPAVRALYMTGNPGPYMAALEAEARLYAAGVIDKPFTRLDLLRAIQALALKTSPSHARKGSLAANLKSYKNRRPLAALSLAHFRVEGRHDRQDDDHRDGGYFADFAAGDRRRVGAG